MESVESEYVIEGFVLNMEDSFPEEKFNTESAAY